MNYCPTCGAPHESGASFCPACGIKLEKNPMDEQLEKKRSRVNSWMAINASKFPESEVLVIKEKLMALPDSKLDSVMYGQFTDPVLTLVLSICLGCLGVDRFVLGDVGLGVGKLLTCGGLYVWWIVDIFSIQTDTRKKNMDKLLGML